MILKLLEYLFLEKVCNILDDDDECDESVYYKILNDFDHIEKTDRNNIVNLINNDNYKHDIT